MIPAFRRLIAISTVSVFGLVSSVQPVMAEFLSTGEVLDLQLDERGELAERILEGRLSQELEKLGMSRNEAAARLAALSDQEVRDLNQSLADMNAGGSSLGTILGAALLVFFVLLATDILGFTKVFPFTRSIR